MNLRWMDRVVCVSAAQARKVRRAGIRDERILVIGNAIRPERFERPDPSFRRQLLRMFPEPPRAIVGAAGRLSPEKGFSVLVDAAAEVVCDMPQTGFVVFGDGPLREPLRRQIAARQLQGRFILAGFRPDFDRYQPHLDLLATAFVYRGFAQRGVGGVGSGRARGGHGRRRNTRVDRDGQTGYLVPPGDAAALAEPDTGNHLRPARRLRLARHGRDRLAAHFSFNAQAARYGDLFRHLSSGALRGQRRGSATPRRPRQTARGAGRLQKCGPHRNANHP